MVVVAIPGLIGKRFLFALAPLLILLLIGEGTQRISDLRKAAKGGPKLDPHSYRVESLDGVPLTERPGRIVLRFHPYLSYRTAPSQRHPA